MVDWRIYYGDGSVYSSNNGGLQIAPKRDVQVVVYTDPEVGRVVLSMRDFYWLAEYGWDGGDIFGLWDYLSQPGSKVVLFGRAVRTPRYREILSRALIDSDFPKKSAWYDWEDNIHAG